MTINVGAADRIVRLVVGLVLVALPFVTNIGLVQSTIGTIISVVVGLVLIGTAAMKTCPLYSVLGIRTTKS